MSEHEAEIPSPPDGLFRDRRRRVLEQLGNDVMVLPAAGILHRSNDSELRYRPDSELHYLTGFEEPDAVLVLRGFADVDRSVLFTRARDREAELWTGPREGPEGARERLGVEVAFPITELPARLPELLLGADRIHARLGVQAALDTLLVTALRLGRAKGAREGTGPRGVLDPGGILDEMRVRKDSWEIERLRRAAQVTTHGFRTALAATAPGVGEWEIEASLEGTFRRLGGAGPAFATIVGGGSNGCVLHYTDNRARLRAGDLVLVDAGAEVALYSGDVSRTWPVSGVLTDAQREVGRIVDRARARAIEAIGPGARIDDVHRSAVEVLVEGLLGLGLLRGDRDSLIEEGAHRRYFPHRTSHWLGIDTHDPGDYRVAGESRSLEPGMVLTVEPGLYFGPGSVAGVEEPPVHPEFLGIGVRIEDDVLVTPSGREVLTADLPTDPEELGALVGAG